MAQKTIHNKALARLLKLPTSKATQLVGDKNGEKSKSFIHNATDTFSELFLLFIGIIVSGGLLYSLFEHQGVLKGFWWACVTAFTVGYGDVVPLTLEGRILGIVLMSLTVFVVVPLITARIATKMIVNDDAWTDVEQKKLMAVIDRINAYLDGLENRKAKTVDSGKINLTSHRGDVSMGGKPSNKKITTERPAEMKPKKPMKPMPRKKGM